MDNHGGNTQDDLIVSLENLMRTWTRACIMFVGTVTAIDNVNFTCTVQSPTGAILNNVPIAVLTGTQGGFVQLPAVNSACLVSFRANDINLPQIVQIDQIDQLLITANKIVFNSGAEGGLVLSTDLVTRMNLIENAFNGLVTLFNAHIHSGVTTGAGVSGPTPTPDGTTLTPTVAADIESTTITQ